MSNYRPFTIEELLPLCGRYVCRMVYVNASLYSLSHLQIIGFANGRVAVGPEYVWPEELLEEYSFADTHERCGVKLAD